MSEQVVENPDQLKFPDPDASINVIEPFNITRFLKLQSLIVLNQEILLSPKVFGAVWSRTKVHIAVDGGADRLLNFCKTHNYAPATFKPDYVIGDFDSVSQETLQIYRDMGVVVIYQETQYSTDLMKALSLCNLVLYFGFQGEEVGSYDGIAKLEQEHIASSTKTLVRNKIFIIGGIGGRLDQTVHSISLLYKYKISNSHLELFYINKEFEDLTFLIPAGENFIKVATEAETAKRIVGLLPFGPEVTLTTKGLKWDVINWSSRIDTKVSSSNHIVSQNGFFVTTDKDTVINMMILENDFV